MFTFIEPPTGGGRSSQVLIEDVQSFCFSDAPVDSSLHRVEIRPVHVDGSAVHPNTSAVPNAYAQQLLKNSTAPKFSGKLQDWSAFVEDWERYLRKTSMGQNLSDALKLELFETTLDEVNQKDLRRRQKRGL